MPFLQHQTFIIKFWLIYHMVHGSTKLQQSNIIVRCKAQNLFCFFSFFFSQQTFGHECTTEMKTVFCMDFKILRWKQHIQCLKHLWGGMDLNTKLRKILNAGNLTLRSWDHWNWTSRNIIWVLNAFTVMRTSNKLPHLHTTETHYVLNTQRKYSKYFMYSNFPFQNIISRYLHSSSHDPLA
jgi:hypothetical protein